jgi:hypothetical protein
MIVTTCPHHHSPLVDLHGQIVCLATQAESLLGQCLVDLVVEDGIVVLLFPNGEPLPLPGWSGNQRAQDEDSADALLEILAGCCLTEAAWQNGRGRILLGDTPQTPCWQFNLYEQIIPPPKT